MANHNHVTRLRRALLAAVGAGVPLSWLLAGGTAVGVPFVDPAAVVPGAAQDGSTSAVVTDAAEGWYAPQLIDLCSTPLGCLPNVIPSLFPANTLHVGVALGTETARTYLEPDLAAVPAGSTIVRAVMTLPVATGTTDGTLSPASAKLVACLATQAFDKGAVNSLKTPPKVACAHGAKLTYDAKHNAFTADLTKIVESWSKGSVDNGVAIMADTSKLALTDLWQVAFNGQKLAGAPHIKTAITFTPPAAGTPTPTATPTDTASSPAGVSPPAPVLPLPGESTADVAPPAPVIAPSPSTRTVALSRSFKYPMAFLFPLGLLAMGVFMTRLFSRDATPVKRR